MLKHRNTSRGNIINNDVDKDFEVVQTMTFPDIIDMLALTTIDLLILDCIGSDRFIDITLLRSLEIKYLYVCITEPSIDRYTSLFSDILWEKYGINYIIKFGKFKYE